VKALLALLLVAVLGTGCSAATESPAPTPAQPITASPSPRPTLADLPTGAPPRIGYVDHQAYVEPSGRRTPLPRRIGVSGIVPYAGGFLVSDTRYFEGSVGLWFVTADSVRDLPGCSTGTPRRVDGWVWWVTALCPESLAGDLARSTVHRARPNGTEHTARVFRPVRDVAMFVRINRYLDRVAPLSAWVREDSRHRLAVVERRGSAAIARIDEDGHRELATRPVRIRGAGPGR
jgi:hypothetical protein